MSEILKKYGFVILVGILLLAGVGYFMFDQSKDILPGKKVDGKDVVYSVGETNITADEFYDQMFEELGAAGIYQFIERLVVDKEIATTDEMTSNAKTNADTVIAQFKSSYGAEYEATLLQAIQAVGYTKIEELQQYFVDAQKYEIFAKAIIEGAYDETVKPRILSHILVKMTDPENPTDEEKAKMDEVDAALAEGQSFSEVAAAFSDDSSAQNGGSLGYSDMNTNFVAEFLEASLALNEGETSGWVKTEFGYHLIRCDASTFETLKTFDEFYDGINTANPTIVIQGIWDKAKEYGVNFTDPAMEEKVLTYLKLNGGAE